MVYYILSDDQIMKYHTLDLLDRSIGGIAYPQNSEGKRSSWETMHLLYNGMAFQPIHLHHWYTRELWAHRLLHDSMDLDMSDEWYNFCIIYLFLHRFLFMIAVLLIITCF